MDIDDATTGIGRGNVGRGAGVAHLNAGVRIQPDSSRILPAKKRKAWGGRKETGGCEVADERWAQGGSESRSECVRGSRAGLTRMVTVAEGEREREHADRWGRGISGSGSELERARRDADRWDYRDRERERGRECARAKRRGASWAC